jgi:hypothetical protein
VGEQDDVRRNIAAAGLRLEQAARRYGEAYAKVKGGTGPQDLLDEGLRLLEEAALGYAAAFGWQAPAGPQTQGGDA